MSRRPAREVVDASAEHLDAAEQEAFDLREERARIGSVGRELDLRALAAEHRAAFTTFLEAVEKLARDVQEGRTTVYEARRFLMTHVKADAHMLGLSSGPAVNWYLRSVLTSPVYVDAMFRAGRGGDALRAKFLEYVEEHGLRPGFEALWRQLGGWNQEPLSA